MECIEYEENPYREVEIEDMAAVEWDRQADEVIPVDEATEAQADFIRRLPNYNELIGRDNEN